MKKIIIILLALVMVLSLAACGGADQQVNAPNSASSVMTIDEMAKHTLETGATVLKERGYSPVYCEYISRYNIDDTVLLNTYLWFNTDEGIRYCGVISEYEGGVFKNSVVNDVVNDPYLPAEKTEPEDSKEYAAMRNKREGSSTEIDNIEEICGQTDVRTFDQLILDYGIAIAEEYMLVYMDNIKNPYSVEIQKAWCKSNGQSYYITISFTAENAFGGHIASTIGNRQFTALYPNDYQTKLHDESMTPYYCIDNQDSEYAKNDSKSIQLDANIIQEYIENNYK